MRRHGVVARDDGARGDAARGDGGAPAEHPLLGVQRAAGNRAAGALVRGAAGGADEPLARGAGLLRAALPAASSGPVAATAPDHPTEREADRIATSLTGTAPSGAPGREPPWIGRAAAARMRSPGAGEPVPQGIRVPVERRLGVDLANVRVHASPGARTLADTLGARAFAYGRGVWLGTGAHLSDRALLAHELVHAAQQAGGAPAVQRQTPPAATRHKVVVVGSVGPGEIAAGNPYQFVNAAVSLGVDGSTIWFVERTGYEAGGVDTSVITRLAGSARLVWITPENTLASQLNALPARSIGSFHVFSHGVAGLVTLRYGWTGRNLSNYGLSVADIESLRADLFAPDATARFDSCNTGTSDWYSPEGNLAQSFADRTGRPVSAWTGRTSYSAVNQAAGSRPAEVGASRVWTGGIRPDTTEIVSQAVLGRTPALRTFSPPSGPRVGGFTSDFTIRVRLPESRHFEVPAGGAVVVRCSNPRMVDEDGEEIGGAAAPTRFNVSLHRSVDWGRDTSSGTRAFPVAWGLHQETWSGLDAGTYYLEIWRGGHTGYPLACDIVVDVHGAPP